MDEDTSVTKSICIQTTPNIRIRMVRMLGIPFFCIQNSEGAQIIDKKSASRKGTTITVADFIPATIIINAAKLIMELF